MSTNSKAGAVLAGRRRTETFERIARWVLPPLAGRDMG
jgi:hypothetical protein